MAESKVTYEQEGVNQIMRGLKEAQAYMEGERQGYKVTAPLAVVAKERPEKAGCPTF